MALRMLLPRVIEAATLIFAQPFCKHKLNVKRTSGVVIVLALLQSICSLWDALVRIIVAGCAV